MRLPSHKQAWRAILHASCLDDYEWSWLDRRYFASFARGPRPPAWAGPDFDDVNGPLGAFGCTKVSCPGEAFSRLCRARRVRTWCQAGQVLDTMRAIPGLETVRLPDSVYSALAGFRERRHVSTRTRKQRCASARLAMSRRSPEARSAAATKAIATRRARLAELDQTPF